MLHRFVRGAGWARGGLGVVATGRVTIEPACSFGVLASTRHERSAAAVDRGDVRQLRAPYHGRPGGASGATWRAARTYPRPSPTASARASASARGLLRRTDPAFTVDELPTTSKVSEAR